MPCFCGSKDMGFHAHDIADDGLIIPKGNTMSRPRPTGRGPGGWGPDYLSVAKLIELIPNDGCLLVFNADHANWRVKVHETGVLRCHVAQNGHGLDKTDIGKRRRDLYITWRDG